MPQSQIMFLLSIIGDGCVVSDEVINIAISTDIDKLKEKAIQYINQDDLESVEIKWTPCTKDNQIHGELVGSIGHHMVIESIVVI